MGDDATLRSVLKWICRRNRTRREAVGRWGHYFDDAVDRGMAAVSGQRVVILGGHRHLVEDVMLTDAGRAEILPTKRRAAPPPVPTPGDTR